MLLPHLAYVALLANAEGVANATDSSFPMLMRCRKRGTAYSCHTGVVGHQPQTTTKFPSLANAGDYYCYTCTTTTTLSRYNVTCMLPWHGMDEGRRWPQSKGEEGL